MSTGGNKIFSKKYRQGEKLWLEYKASLFKTPSKFIWAASEKNLEVLDGFKKFVP
jgi:hypothetical protein